MRKAKIKVANSIGIRAMACVFLVRAANKFKSDIDIEFNSIILNAKSLMSVKSLNMYRGDEFTLIADGPDEDEAIETISQLIESGFSFLEQRKVFFDNQNIGN